METDERKTLTAEAAEKRGEQPVFSAILRDLRGYSFSETR